MAPSTHKKLGEILYLLICSFLLCLEGIMNYPVHGPYYKEYYCNIIIWTMYNIYEIFYLIAVYKLKAADTV